MKHTAKYLVSIWRNGDPDPETECVVFPPDDWGTVAADMDLVKADLQDLQADDLIDRYVITEQTSTDIDKAEMLKWLEQIRQEQE